LLERVEREDVAGKRLLAVDEKYYTVDSGLRRAITGERPGATSTKFWRVSCWGNC
jgi:hypothetical protein